MAKEYAQSRDAVGRGFMQELSDELGRLNLSVPQFAEIEDTLKLVKDKITAYYAE